ncbi:response regulator [Fulvimarina endophytica]|uniref:Response regulator n=1 Tax=Fulvimarina endophytica TaxID=2293836 RepID=A0A371X2N3_9HYPH|nr:DNA-binding response regulator [Fulvimarina endophytica]RFC63487.1 response regulator [Fulvimarina endophytica]
MNVRTETSILVVDDALDTARMLVDAISLTGQSATTALSGFEAIRSIDETVPDLILLDAMMPGIDGFETCARLKADPRTSEVPVIFMTGFNETEHVVRAFAAGGADFIAKPINLDELFARMNVHLSQMRRQRSARIALETTGRRIVSIGSSGVLNWSTRQAADLLEAAGIASRQGERMPISVVEWLSLRTELPHLYDAAGIPVEFRVLERTEDHILVRLIDRTAGTDEERLASAFGLSLREAEVLLWIAHGKSNKEIGDILDMSHRTANKHLEQIFMKLGVENRTAAATTAVRVLLAET